MVTLSTGITALDEGVLDSLPKGYTMLVCGSPGFGMELLAKQFAAAGIGSEEVVYISTNECGEEVSTTMTKFKWKPGGIKIIDFFTLYYERMLAKELEISRYREEGVALTDVQKFTLDVRRKDVNFLTTMMYELSRLKPPYRLIIDSIDFLLEHYEPRNVLSTLRTIKAHAHRNESAVLITMLTNVHDLKTQSGIEELADCIIELSREKYENGFRNFLVIRKVRNHPEKTGIIEYVVTPTGLKKK